MKIKAHSIALVQCSTPTVKNRKVIQYIICDAEYTKVLQEWNEEHINIKRKQKPYATQYIEPKVISTAK